MTSPMDGIQVFCSLWHGEFILQYSSVKGLITAGTPARSAY